MLPDGVIKPQWVNTFDVWILPDMSSEVRGLSYISLNELMNEILWKLILFWLWFYWPRQVTNLYMLCQLNCHSMCKIVTWSNYYFSHKHNMNPYEIWDHELIKYLWNGAWLHDEYTAGYGSHWHRCCVCWDRGNEWYDATREVRLLSELSNFLVNLVAWQASSPLNSTCPPLNGSCPHCM